MENTVSKRVSAIIVRKYRVENIGDQCAKILYQQKLGYQYVKIHVSEKHTGETVTFYCGYCNKEFKNVYTKRKHEKRDHAREIKRGSKAD